MPTTLGMFEGQYGRERTYIRWILKRQNGVVVEEAVKTPVVVPIHRFGKTQRDVEGHEHRGKRHGPSHGNRFKNREPRNTWYQEGGRKGPFPEETCNGKATRALRAARKRRKKKAA